MAELDEFESIFKSASKRRYEHAPVEIRRALVITDLGGDAARLFSKDVRDFLSGVLPADSIEWVEAEGGEYADVGDLLERIEALRPDLICTYRNLHGRARGYPFSLGAHVDVLTQATPTPVLLLPPPTEDDRLAPSCKSTKEVTVLTDHLTGADQLIHWAVRIADPSGRLFLVHLEDDATFDRYIEVISKLPSIPTDIARHDIAKQLLKEPTDYIRSIVEGLQEASSSLAVESVVEMGHHIADVERLVKDHAVDLVVMNTKDDDQLAMHGLAYALAVELRDLPLLML